MAGRSSSSSSSAPFVTSGGVRVTGAWTRAGLGSCIRVQGANKQDDLLFDCGVCEPDTISAGFVFISHGHVDHIGASVMHARSKALTKKTATYYVPVDSVGPLEEARAAFSKLDGGDIPMNIVPLQPGESVVVNGELVVKAFPTVHRVPSQGYALYKRTRSKALLPEYTHRKHEIEELRRQGLQVYAETSAETLELVYTGDTTFDGLLDERNRFIFSAQILIMELTYLDGERSRAVDRGHVCIDDVIEHAQLFTTCDHVVFCHISERYAPHGKALSILREKLPEDFAARCSVSLRSFGSGEHLTSLAAVDFGKRSAEVGWGSATRVGADIVYCCHGRVPECAGRMGNDGRGISVDWPLAFRAWFRCRRSLPAVVCRCIREQQRRRWRRWTW